MLTIQIKTLQVRKILVSMSIKNNTLSKNVITEWLMSRKGLNLKASLSSLLLLGGAFF